SVACFRLMLWLRLCRRVRGVTLRSVTLHAGHNLALTPTPEKVKTSTLGSWYSMISIRGCAANPVLPRSMMMLKIIENFIGVSPQIIIVAGPVLYKKSQLPDGIPGHYSHWMRLRWSRSGKAPEFRYWNRCAFSGNEVCWSAGAEPSMHLRYY